MRDLLQHLVSEQAREARLAPARRARDENQIEAALGKARLEHVQVMHVQLDALDRRILEERPAKSSGHGREAFERADLELLARDRSRERLELLVERARRAGVGL